MMFKWLSHILIFATLLQCLLIVKEDLYLALIFQHSVLNAK